jgi:hypothetical protein
VSRICGECLLRMRRITIRRARTWHYRKMRPCIEQSNGPVSLSPFRSWQDCIINTSGYDFRKGQVMKAAYEAALVDVGVTDRDDPITELIAKAIVNVTASGERNPKEVMERALNALGVRRSAA